MMRFKKSMRLAAVAGLTLMTAAVLSAQYRVTGKFGRKQINGRNLIVHVTVAAPVGVPAGPIADRELINRGAAPLGSSPFVALGPVWEDSAGGGVGADNLVQSYNDMGGGGAIPDPTSGGGAAYTHAQTTWSAVSTSRFAFKDSGATTNRCPSLVEECDGGQLTDTYHDVGWCNLGVLHPIFGGILGVTWFEWDAATNKMIEADVCLNGDGSVPWSITGTSDIDVDTVMLHELGHVATIGHSRTRKAVMYASYLGVRRELHGDDVNAISTLYPGDDGGVDPPGSCVVPDGLPLGSSCTNDGDCCSGKCKGKPRGKVCK